MMIVACIIVKYGTKMEIKNLTTTTNIVVVVKVATAVRGGGLDPRTAIELSFSVGGGLEKPNRGRDRGETAVAIAKATRPFKFREIAVSNSTRSFVSSIHSLALRSWH